MDEYFDPEISVDEADGGWALGERRPKARVPAEKGWKIARQVKRQLASYAEAIIVAGSLRRRELTVGDVELVVLPNDVGEFIDHVAQMGYTGGNRIRKKMVDGLTVELYIAHAPEEMGSMVQMYSGDYLLNIALRSRAKRMGLKYDQYGLTKDGRVVLQSPDERDFFEYLGMAWHEPEQRSLGRRSELEKMIRALREMELSRKDKAFVEDAKIRLKEDKYLPPEAQLRLEALAKKYLRGRKASMGAEELVELGSLEWSPRASTTEEWRIPDGEDEGGMIWYGPEGREGYTASEVTWDSANYRFCEYTPSVMEEEPQGPIMRACTSFSRNHLWWVLRERGIIVGLKQVDENPKNYARWAASVGASKLANMGPDLVDFVDELP